MLHQKFSAKKTIKQLSKSSVFRSIIVLPHVSFENQERKEKVVLIIRRHPFMLFAKIFFNFLYLVLGYIFIYLLSTGMGGIFVEIPDFVIFVLYLLNTAFFVTGVLYSFVTWYFNMVIATTERIIDVDFLSILETKWSEARLAKIEDVSVSSPGFLSTLLDMGNLFVQTAGAKVEFEIRHIPKPLRVQDVLMDLVTAVRAGGLTVNKSNKKKK